MGHARSNSLDAPPAAACARKSTCMMHAMSLMTAHLHDRPMQLQKARVLRCTGLFSALSCAPQFFVMHSLAAHWVLWHGQYHCHAQVYSFQERLFKSKQSRKSVTSVGPAADGGSWSCSRKHRCSGQGIPHQCYGRHAARLSSKECQGQGSCADAPAVRRRRRRSSCGLMSFRPRRSCALMNVNVHGNGQLVQIHLASFRALRCNQSRGSAT